MATERKTPIHSIVYGHTGTGKSTFATTFPRPGLAFIFDAYGKDVPYLDLGEPGEIDYDEDGVPFLEVTSRRTGSVLWRLEYYHEDQTAFALATAQTKSATKTLVQTMRPTAYARFLKRLARFRVQEEPWQTIALDSVTSLELATRKYHQYTVNPHSTEPRQWFASSTDSVEELLMLRFSSLPINVVVTAHIDEDRQFTDQGQTRLVHNDRPALPGRMRTRLGSQYNEVYYAYVETEDDGQAQYLLQTQADRRHIATSNVCRAPNPCPNVYTALWSNRE